MTSQITLYRPNERRLFTYRELSQIIDPKSTGGIIAIDNKKFIGECLPNPKQFLPPIKTFIKLLALRFQGNDRQRTEIKSRGSNTG